MPTKIRLICRLATGSKDQCDFPTCNYTRSYLPTAKLHNQSRVQLKFNWTMDKFMTLLRLPYNMSNQNIFNNIKFNIETHAAGIELRKNSMGRERLRRTK